MLTSTKSEAVMSLILISNYAEMLYLRDQPELNGMLVAAFR